MSGCLAQSKVYRGAAVPMSRSCSCRPPSREWVMQLVLGEWPLRDSMVGRYAQWASNASCHTGVQTLVRIRWFARCVLSKQTDVWGDGGCRLVNWCSSMITSVIDLGLLYKAGWQSICTMAEPLRIHICNVSALAAPRKRDASKTRLVTSSVRSTCTFSCLQELAGVASMLMPVPQFQNPQQTASFRS